MSLIRAVKILCINLAVLLLMLGLVAFSGEVYFRFIKTQPSDSFGYWLAAYPNAGNDIYKLKPGFYRQFYGDNEESFVVDTRGVRLENYRDKKIDTIFYGDSFTFGHGVKQGERFSDLYAESNKNLNVANFAYTAGFTAPHYRLHFKLNSNLAPERINVFTYLGNDCQSDMAESVLLGYSEGGYPTRQISNAGRLTGNRSAHGDLLNWFADHSMFVNKLIQSLYGSRYGDLFFSSAARPNALNSRDFDLGNDKTACRENLRYLKALEYECNSRNPKCQLWNYIIPQNFLAYISKSQNSHTQLSEAEILRSYEDPVLVKNVMENCKEARVRCVNLLPILRPYGSSVWIESDGHWNSKGHRAVLKAIGRQ